MSDSKISSLTELAEAPATNDEFVIVDKSDTTQGATGTTKKIQSQYVTIADATASTKGKALLMEGQINGATAKTTPVDADLIGIVDTEASNVLKKLTWANAKATLLSWLRLSTTIIPVNAPEGFLINGKIVPSVTSNNLTVAIKTLAGTDPSASNPVYVRIGDSMRTITSALSRTLNAGTNWCAAGSAELATKELDFFTYLGYNATDGVVIGHSRIPYANQYSEFSTTATNEKYCAISTITNAVATDPYVVIGRFPATLSAGAGYTWSVPTFTPANLKQYPIFENRAVETNTNKLFSIVGDKLYLTGLWAVQQDGASSGYGYISCAGLFPNAFTATSKVLSVSTVCNEGYYGAYISSLQYSDASSFQFRVNGKISGSVRGSVVVSLR